MIVRMITRFGEIREFSTNGQSVHDLNQKMKNFWDTIIRSMDNSLKEGKHIEIKISNFK